MFKALLSTPAWVHDKATIDTPDGVVKSPNRGTPRGGAVGRTPTAETSPKAAGAKPYTLPRGMIQRVGWPVIAAMRSKASS
jgi:hypothetical protein